MKDSSLSLDTFLHLDIKAGNMDLPHGVIHRLFPWCHDVRLWPGTRHRLKHLGAETIVLNLLFSISKDTAGGLCWFWTFTPLFSGALLLVLPFLFWPTSSQEDIGTRGRKGRHSTDTAKKKAPPQGRGAGNPLRQFWGGSNPAAYLSKRRHPVKDTPNSSFSRIFK